MSLPSLNGIYWIILRIISGGIAAETRFSRDLGEAAGVTILIYPYDVLLT